MRFAAGVFLLSTGLLIGSAGGGIAAADTDSGGSSGSSGSSSSSGSASSASTASQGAESSSQASSATSTPASSVAENLRKSLRESIQSTLSALTKPGQQQSGLPKTPVTKPESTAVDVKDEKKGSESTDAVSTSLISKSNDVASNSKPAGSDSHAVETAAASAPADTPPGADRREAVRKVVDPIANAVVTVTTVALAVPGVIAALPTSPTPLADVIASLQVMLTTVGDAVVPLATQLPSNIYSLLVVLTNNPAADTAMATSNSSGSFTTVVAPALGFPLPPQDTPPPPGPPATSLLGNGAAPAPLAEIQTAALRQDFSLSGTSALEQEGTTAPAVKAFLDHTIDAILLPASLSALAAFALPGVVGLIIACAAGMRVGYRQAKAAMAARNSGIARFAGTGPLGIVRSGSLIALRRPHKSRLASLRTMPGAEHVA